MFYARAPYLHPRGTNPVPVPVCPISDLSAIVPAALVSYTSTLLTYMPQYCRRGSPNNMCGMTFHAWIRSRKSYFVDFCWNTHDDIVVVGFNLVHWFYGSGDQAEFLFLRLVHFCPLIYLSPRDQLLQRFFYRQPRWIWRLIAVFQASNAA